MPKRKYMRIKDFAEIFCFPKQTVSNLIKKRIIYAEKMPGTDTWRIPVEEEDRYRKRAKQETQNDVFTRNF